MRYVYVVAFGLLLLYIYIYILSASIVFFYISEYPNFFQSKFPYNEKYHINNKINGDYQPAIIDGPK